MGGFWKTPNNFYTEVAKGNVPQHSAINKFGHNDSVVITGEDIWSGGGTYGFYPSSAQSMEIVSDNVNDTSAGTGARTVQVFGLDSNWDEIDETVTLNGTTAVSLVNNYIRVYRSIVLTAGSNETNLGNISVQISGGGTVGAYIAADDGQTQQAVYTIPNGKTGYFLKWYVGFDDNDKNGEAAGFKWRSRPNNISNGAWQTKGQISCVNIGSSWWQYEYTVPETKLLEKTDIRVECFETTATVGVVGGFDILLVDNPS